MEALDYNAFRDRLADSLSEAGMRVTVEEAVYLGTLSRGCDIFIYPASEGPDVWGKVAFEWAPDNQALLEEIEHESEYGNNHIDEIDISSSQVMMHCEFHLHFGRLAVSTEVVSDVAGNIKKLAEEYFGDDGGIVAEVYLSSDEAKLDCLRYEVNTSAPMVTDEPWWENWGVMCRGMLVHVADVYIRLENMFGPQRN